MHHPIVPPLKTTMFESICFTVTGTVTTVVAVLLLYRPRSVMVTDAFFYELSAYLDVLALYKCQVVIAGDFNIHMEITDDQHPITLADVIAGVDCIKNVQLQPTHRDVGTLDLVVPK